MENEYVKETNIVEKNEDEKNRELIASILKTQRTLEQAHQNFEFAEDDLIDYYSFKIKANQAKLDYLIKLAKTKGLIMDANLQQKLNDKQEVS